MCLYVDNWVSKEEAEENIEKFEDGMDWVQLNNVATYDVEVI